MAFDKNIDIRNKNIFDKIPCNKKLYFNAFGWYNVLYCHFQHYPYHPLSDYAYYPLWDNPNPVFHLCNPYRIDAASVFFLLWYYFHRDNVEACVAVLNPGIEVIGTASERKLFPQHTKTEIIAGKASEKQKFFPQHTESVFPYIEKHLENISGQQIDRDKREELLKRIEENNFLPPKAVLPYFPFWQEIESKEYFYSVVKTNIECEGKTCIDVTFSRERNPRLQAIQLLGAPELCPKCGDNSWSFVSLSSNNKAARWQCNFCHAALLLRADRPRQTENSNGSARQPIPKDVQREVWRRDHGRCVECGSQELLEFDHIIAVSKGGANTVRNLQLLCESCNRRKSGKAPGH